MNSCVKRDSKGKKSRGDSRFVNMQTAYGELQTYICIESPMSTMVEIPAQKSFFHFYCIFWCTNRLKLLFQTNTSIWFGVKINSNQKFYMNWAYMRFGNIRMCSSHNLRTKPTNMIVARFQQHTCRKSMFSADAHLLPTHGPTNDFVYS